MLSSQAKFLELEFADLVVSANPHIWSRLQVTKSIPPLQGTAHFNLGCAYAIDAELVSAGDRRLCQRREDRPSAISWLTGRRD